MADRLRVAVIGCGGRGRVHLAILRDQPDVEIAAVCDVRREAAEAAGAAFGAAGRFTDVETLLSETAPDAVVVAATVTENARVAALPLSRGIPTLLEKPPGMSAAETRALRETAARAGGIAMVGWNRRFHPMIVQARAAIAARGPVTQVVGEFHKSMARIIAAEAFPPDVLDRQLLESPIHAVDLVRAAAGAPVVEVHSLVRRAASPYRDVHGALIRFANGCVGHLIANYTTDARLERYEIHGHGISAYLEGVDRGELLCDGERRPLASDPPGNGTREQDRAFLDCVRHRRPPGPPAADLDEAVATMELADAILGSPE
jgi:predicted dehydrogenase